MNAPRMASSHPPGPLASFGARDNAPRACLITHCSRGGGFVPIGNPMNRVPANPMYPVS